MSLLAKIFSKNKKLQVDFCERNLDRFLTAEQYPMYEAFFKQKNIVYKEYKCQSKCEQCEQSPYAIVNGEFIQADDSTALLRKLKQLQS
ncbi:DUF1450 domain-containing protein [Bacillus sp. B15-48]|uniref:DUF1450 domain-containing protein n=1 Tax=Bacillus sp. B15-48 TaxID=1548601 RepID=UPI0019400DE5|nr:DUF1450 domain-containing protein [Bacillus sp. B15-48]MBM4760795.1 DUF1450 domain-containing protein [Bacillus sp. B15-48]